MPAPVIRAPTFFLVLEGFVPSLYASTVAREYIYIYQMQTKPVEQRYADFRPPPPIQVYKSKQSLTKLKLHSPLVFRPKTVSLNTDSSSTCLLYTSPSPRD